MFLPPFTQVSLTRFCVFVFNVNVNGCFLCSNRFQPIPIFFGILVCCPCVETDCQRGQSQEDLWTAHRSIAWTNIETNNHSHSLDSHVKTYPVLAKFVQYVITTALSITSFLEKLHGNSSVGPIIGNPNTYGISSPCDASAHGGTWEVECETEQYCYLCETRPYKS